MYELDGHIHWEVGDYLESDCLEEDHCLIVNYELWGDSDILAYKPFNPLNLFEGFPANVVFAPEKVFGSGTPCIFQVTNTNKQPLAFVELLNHDPCTQGKHYAITNIILPLKALLAVHKGIMKVPIPGVINIVSLDHASHNPKF